MAALSGLFVASRVAIFACLAGRWSDIWIYEQYVHRLVQGEIPFREFFPEYPPLALWFMCVPAAFTLDAYPLAFRILCCAIDVGIWLSLCSVAKRGEIAWPELLLYVLATAALGPILYDRLDIGLAALLLWAAIWLRRDELAKCQAAVGLGVAFKLIPVVLVPFLLGLQWRRERRGLLWAGALLAGPTLISLGAVAAAGGYRIDKLFAYHLQRGTEIESVPASIQMVLMLGGADGAVYAAYGCDNLTTAYEQPLTTACTGLLAAVVLGSSGVALGSALSPGTAALWLAAILAAALALSKVLSTQYFIFLLPVLLAPRPNGAFKRLASLALIGVTFGLTGAIFPWYFTDLRLQNAGAVAMVVLRNACLCALTAALLRRAWRAAAEDAGTLRRAAV